MFKRHMSSIVQGIAGLGTLVLYMVAHPSVMVLTTMGQQAKISDRDAKHNIQRIS